MVNSWWLLKNLNTELPYDPAILPLGGRRPKELTGTRLLVHQCAQQHYSPWSKGGNNPSVHLEMNKQNVVDMYIQWNFIRL